MSKVSSLQRAADFSRKLMNNRFILGWSSLSAISNSQAARMTVLIPLVGYLVIFNEKAAGFLKLIPVLSPSDALYEVSPRLLLFYLGLCSIAVGVALYSWRCPPAIKGFSTAANYIIKMQGTVSGPSLREIEVSVASDPAMADEWEALRIVQTKTLTPTDTYIRSLLYLHFKSLDRSRPFSTYANAFAYAWGFYLLLVPSLQVFARVVKIMWRQFEIALRTSGILP